MAETGGVIRTHQHSTVPKRVFAGLHLAILALCAWLAFGNINWPDPIRAQLLFACAALYFARHLITLFVLLKRRVDYSESLGLSVFILTFEAGFLLLGAGILRDAPIPFSLWDGFAVALVLLGSFLNTGSELQRWAWKKKPDSVGKCYTKGLFAYSMHINYFGDVLLFSGWAILTASFLSAIIPVFILLSFVFYHIPALDRYLADRYKQDFALYASKTAKLVPFIY